MRVWFGKYDPEEPWFRDRTPTDSMLARLPMGDPDECWEWPGQRTIKGYGTVRRVRKDGSGKSLNFYVHRLSYEHFHGPIPEGLEVMHSCDNPPCANPNHLSVGTHAENLADMRRKGRAVDQKTA